MPQLPSGFHVALDPAPLHKLIEQTFEGKCVHCLMPIKHRIGLYEYINVLYLRPKSSGALPTLDERSIPLPANHESYHSGYNLLTIKEPYERWCEEDQRAFVAFLDEARTQEFLNDLLQDVQAMQEHLLSQSSTLPGLLATWWKFGCHPLQETFED